MFSLMEIVTPLTLTVLALIFYILHNKKEARSKK